jgi:thymidylate synthase (FAD)
MAEFKVKLIGWTENPQLLSVAGALGCFEEKSSAQLIEELLGLPEEQRLKRERGVLKNSFGRGHGSVGDQTYFIFSIENLPRAATLQLCLPQYLAHLQQSLRRAKASRGFYFPETIKKSRLGRKTEDLLSQTFTLYEKMVQAGIPGEDARFLLPLYTKTNIQTGGNARELCHLWQMSHQEGVPSIVTAVVDEMTSQAKERAPYLFEDFGFNYETLAWYPSSQLFAATNETMKKLIESLRGNKKKAILLGWMSPIPVTLEILRRAIRGRDEAELSNLKRVHFEFLVPMSLACFHQATRQRTWDHSIESIYDAVENAILAREERIVVPPSVKNSDFLPKYKDLHCQLINLYKELVEGGISKSEAIGVIPHSLKIYDAIHINGWNAIHSIGKRTCLEAQWEIRFIAQKMANDIKEAIPAFKEWAEPQCITYGKCPEVKDCGYYKKKKT